jgi:hypothetical protein
MARTMSRSAMGMISMEFIGAGRGIGGAHADWLTPVFDAIDVTGRKELTVCCLSAV